MLLSTQTNSDLLIDESPDPIKLAIVIKSYLPIIKKADQMLEYFYSQNIDKSKIVESKNCLEHIHDNIQKTYGDFASEEHTKYLKELESKIEILNNAVEITGKSLTLSPAQSSKKIILKDRETQSDMGYDEQAMSENILRLQKIIDTLIRENSALKDENLALKDENLALKEKLASLCNMASLHNNQEPVILSSSPSLLSLNVSSTDAQQNFPPPSHQSSNVTTAGSTSVTASLVVVSEQNSSFIQTFVNRSSSRSDIQNPDIHNSETGCFSKLKIIGKQFCGYLAK